MKNTEGKRGNAGNQHFLLFPTVFSTLSRLEIIILAMFDLLSADGREIIILAMFDLLSADGFNLVRSKILWLGKDVKFEICGKR